MRKYSAVSVFRGQSQYVIRADTRNAQGLKTCFQKRCVFHCYSDQVNNSEEAFNERLGHLSKCTSTCVGFN